MPYGSTYCSTCRPIVEAEREAQLQEKIKQNKRKYNKEYNKKRDPKYVRFYNGGDWRALSAKRLSDDDYKCEWCGKVATEVDHIIAIQTPEGWERRLDYANTRSLCHDCHDRRHGRFIKKNVLKVPKMR
jgi:5-methylcytosine-specific restriction endonuclease McrA